ncbi:PHP domain-containing protein [Patescibacteria group bacterium]|nr:PHP domain-containing protein [Patescibacteria group bacterium]MCG2702170.1 PHP domain-containing protein [Candidatus Parcubacteria bacterium]MBU4265346.1 PHP domain-containing protein [Patescibacteria group bacterium]MBU4390786.1 PHP domain-containing protein [Patescibacteria group bacterium]MBU4397672.1 PHP domain-containing protein [Patescibacteria group bacterium]
MSYIWEEFTISSPKLFDLLSKVDLHLHSHFSDGLVFPNDVVSQAQNKGYKYISVTDHNSIGGYDQKLLKQCQENPINLIPGVEMDCGQGLDILVYDKLSNSISPEFLTQIGAITKSENSKRLDVASNCLKVIIKSLDKYNFPWLNWPTWDDNQKQKFISKFTTENLLKINLDSGELDIQGRDYYISKSHIIRLALVLDLINVPKFNEHFQVDNPKKTGKKLKKILFKDFCHWEYDESGVDESLLTRLKKTGFVLVLAHPGKAYEDSEPKSISESSFRQFVAHTFRNFQLDGVECQYRNYKDQPFDYNKIAFESLKSIANNKKVIITAGSDSHKGFPG